MKGYWIFFLNFLKKTRLLQNLSFSNVMERISSESAKCFHLVFVRLYPIAARLDLLPLNFKLI